LTPTEDDNEPPSNRKGPSLLAAMISYAAIALLAAFTLNGKFLWVVWIFLAGLAVRTYLATLRKP
jgi:hypothetical protein